MYNFEQIKTIESLQEISSTFLDISFEIYDSGGGTAQQKQMLRKLGIKNCLVIVNKIDLYGILNLVKSAYGSSSKFTKFCRLTDGHYQLIVTPPPDLIWKSATINFEIKQGDTLVLEEYDPETKTYTGRSIKKKVKNLNKVNLSDFHTLEEIKEHGHWVIELE